jgi:hypothetical protein
VGSAGREAIAAFIPLAWLDTWALAASLRGKLPLFEERALGLSVFTAVNEQKLDKEAASDKWRALYNMIARIRKLSSPPPHLVSIRLERLAGGAASMWAKHSDMVAVLPIISNPAAWHFSGPSAQVLLPGALTGLDARLPRCALNLWADAPSIFMVVEYRAKPIEDE